MRRREFEVILCGLAAIYLPLSLFPAPDLRIFLLPWLDQIRLTGFSVPVGNYSPPYLYLLWLFSPLPNFYAVKLLSIVGVCWLAWCASRLANDLCADRLMTAALTLALPTVILNGPVLGQCDSFWTGFCVLAVAEAKKDRPYRMAFWAGCAFAFKAQSAFLAPFCLWFAIRNRAWGAVVIPPLVYLVAILPAALAGWPIADLLTVYLRQTQFNWIGDAPNLWAIPAALHLSGSAIYLVGYALAAVGAAYIVSCRKVSILDLALLSSLLIPFLLPKMLERFFFLADVLSLIIACARRDRGSITVAVLIQCGSFLSITAYLAGWPWLNAIASLPMAAAIVMLLATMTRAFLDEATFLRTRSQARPNQWSISLQMPVHQSGAAPSDEVGTS